MSFGKTACIGLEISDNFVFVTEVVFSKRQIHISKMIEIPIEPGIVTDGNIQNPEELGFIIREQLKAADIKTKAARVVVPSRYVVIRQISMPKLATKDVRQAIEFELRNTIHLPFDDHVFDYVKLHLQKVQMDESQEEIPDADMLAGNQEPYIVVAADREVVEHIVTAMEVAGLKPKSVDVRALALHRLYTYSTKEKNVQNQIEQTAIFVDIAEQATDIHIFRGSYLLFTRNVPLPLVNYRKSNNFDYTNEQIESTQNDAIDIFTFVQDLSYEIDRSINFYQYSLNNRDQQVSRIVVTGILTDVELLLDYFQKRMDHNFTWIPSEAFIMSDNKMNEQIFRKHAIAIGLAIREDKRIWK